MNIGDAIRDVRLKRKISQLDLAKQLKVTQGFLSLIEKNRREPSLALISQIAETLRVPVEIILLNACKTTNKQRKYNKELRAIANAMDDVLNAITCGAK